MKQRWLWWPRKKKTTPSTNDEYTPELATAKSQADHLDARLRDLRVRRSASTQKGAV